MCSVNYGKSMGSFYTSYWLKLAVASSDPKETPIGERSVINCTGLI